MRFLRILVAMLIAEMTAHGQVLAVPTDRFVRTADQLTSMSSQDIRRYLDGAWEGDLPPSSVDSIVFLATTREPLVLPLLIANIRLRTDVSEYDSGKVLKLENILAYLATSASTDAVLDLYEANSQKLTAMICKSLSYSAGRRNPLEVAYRVMEKGGAFAKEGVSEWIAENISKGNNIEKWAWYMLAIQVDQKTDSELHSDSILSNLDDITRNKLRMEVQRQRSRLSQENQKAR